MSHPTHANMASKYKMMIAKITTTTEAVVPTTMVIKVTLVLDKNSKIEVKVNNTNYTIRGNEFVYKTNQMSQIEALSVNKCMELKREQIIRF